MGSLNVCLGDESFDSVFISQTLSTTVSKNTFGRYRAKIFNFVKMSVD